MLGRLVDLLSGHSLHVGYGAVFFVLVLCGFGLPLPEDVVLVTGGVLAWLASPINARNGTATFASLLKDPGLHAMIGFGLGGILAGDSIIFWAGRRFGARVAEIGPLRRIVTPQKMEEVERLIRRRGNVVVMIARFLPGLRAPTYFTVGHARLPFWEFLLFDGVAALVSAPLWVCLGFYFGANIEDAAHVAKRFSHVILLAVGVVVAAIAIRWWQRRRAVAAGDGEPPADGTPPAPQA
jgi:membrane protein DedA with SNARE-associated domain